MVLGISRSIFSIRDLRLKQLVKFNHVFQLAFQLPVRLARVRLLPGPFGWRPRPWRLCVSSEAFNDFTWLARPAMMPLTRASISVFNSSASCLLAHDVRIIRAVIHLQRRPGIVRSGAAGSTNRSRSESEMIVGRTSRSSAGFVACNDCNPANCTTLFM